MKKIIKYLLLLIIILPFVFLSSCDDSKHVSKLFSNDPLDRIDYYEIKIDPRVDGTLDMKYKITWTVLNDKSEGPLTWIKIGIPNCYVNEIKPLTNNIDEIDYYSDEGSYIRIDLDKKYYKNETLTFEFSFHQERMYHLNNEEVYYNFVPGWFEDIKVNNIIVLWNNKNVINANNNNAVENYLVWNYELDFGESITVDVTYNKDSFVSLSEDLQYSDNYMTKGEKITIIIVVSALVIALIAIIIISIKLSDPYMSHRGFIGRRTHFNRYYYYHHYYSSGVNSKGVVIVNPNSSSGGVSGGSSCACACACAGGGRAGCSRKDFNHHSIDVEPIKSKLNKKVANN